MYKITGTSPSGHVWHHSSHYKTKTGVIQGLKAVVQRERANAETLWDDMEPRALGLRIGESITLPNGWTFTIVAQEETMTQ